MNEIMSDLVGQKCVLKVGELVLTGEYKLGIFVVVDSPSSFP